MRQGHPDVESQSRVGLIDNSMNACDSFWMPLGGATLLVTCVILIFVFGTPGVASLLAMLPYGYYWKHRIDMQRIRMGFPTSNSARAQEVEPSAYAAKQDEGSNVPVVDAVIVPNIGESGQNRGSTPQAVVYAKSVS